MCSGCFLKANGLQVDARSRNGPEKIEYRMDFGSPLGGQIETKSTKKTLQSSRRFWKAFFMDSDHILDAFCLYFRELFRVTFRTCEFKDYIWKTNTKSRSRPSKIDQKSMKKRHRNPEALFVHFLTDLASILTSNLEPFGHRGPSKNVSKIRPRKRAGKPRIIFFLRAYPGRPPTAYNVWIHQKDRPEGRFSACLNTPKRSTRRSLFGTCSGKPAPNFRCDFERRFIWIPIPFWMLFASIFVSFFG